MLIAEVNRVALLLHKMPRTIMTMSQEEMTSIWNEYIEMTLEMSGKGRPKLYEYERFALDNLRKGFDDRS